MKAKARPPCELTGHEMMTTECEHCLQEIHFFKLNSDGSQRRTPRFHNGHCSAMGEDSKVRMIAARELKKRQPKQQGELDLHVKGELK